MPVAGLPAALEASLSSLLVSQGLSSWKVVGEPGASTVVLRFSQCNGQPLLEGRNIRGTFKRKPPSSVRRDRLRAELHRAKGEQNVPSLRPTIEPDANDVGVATTHEAAVASDLPRRHVDTTENNNEADRPSPDSDHEHTATTDPTPPPAAQDEVTAEVFEEIFGRMTKKLTDRMEEISENIAGTRNELALATTSQAVPQLIPSRSSYQPASRPSKAPDQDPPDEDEVKISGRDRPPPTTHRAREDDNVQPPRGRSVEAKRKLRSARFARSDWPT